jgi:lipoprotein-anchoring transpeptidase ErfK/SrfK
VMSPRFDFLSRRDFLKLTGVGLLSALFPGLTKTSAASGLLPDQKGRVAAEHLQVYAAPSFDAEVVDEHWQDILLPITGLEISDDVEAYNRVWYKIGEEGYAYSGSIQPVLTRLNKPIYEHGKTGSLAEVSVPYTDARREPDDDAELAYRLYYETTHWIVETVVNEETNKVWYLLRDDKWNDEKYYVLASHLRPIPDAELTPISPDVPNYLKRIDVRLNEQLVIAYENNRPVYAARVSTGTRFVDGKFYTPDGSFITYYKRPSRHMASNNLASNGYDLPGVPWVLYITKGGISFHGTYWHNDFGAPRSHGCINMTAQSAKWLYRWANPIVPPEKEFVYGYTGTPVEIF